MATPNRSTRPTYSKEQLGKFYDRIMLPTAIRERITSPSFTPDLETLQALQLYTICSIPFECLSLHYSKDRKITITPDFLYKKIVADGRYGGNRRGGYCMENNTLFGTVLRSIGYTCSPVGARVNSEINEEKGEPVYFAWSHMVNIIAINDIRYLVDVGFGANGPHHPLPLLTSGAGYPMQNVGPSQIRLVHEPIPDALDQEQKHWIVQHRYDSESRWIRAYATPAIEFLPQDFEMMNHHTSTGPGMFTDNVICTLLLMDEAGEKLVGNLTLMNYDLKERRNGQSRLIEKFDSENGRINGIRKSFGIVFSAEEQAAIFEKVGGKN